MNTYPFFTIHLFRKSLFTKPTFNKLSLCLLLTVFTANLSFAETLIPRSVSGDKGKYYLLEMKKKGDIVSALHKRVGVYGNDFTRTETNCKTMQMREIGTGMDSVKNIKHAPTKWFELAAGSSKSDLAHFVCKKK